MTLPVSFPLSASQINVELGRAAGAAFDIQGAEERELAGVPAGAISMSDFLGKSSFLGAYITRYGLSGGGSSTLTANIDVPDPKTYRRIILGFSWRGPAADRSVSSGTIGGIPIVIHRQIHQSGGVGSLGAAVVSAIVPTGTTAIPVVLNMSGSTTDGGIGVWSLNHGNTIVDTGAAQSADPTAAISDTVATQNPGFVVAAYTGSVGVGNVPISWTNATERYDLEYNSAQRHGGADAAGTGSNLTITATQGAVFSAGNELAIVSFGF